MKVKVIGSGSMWTKYNSACYLIDEDVMVDFPNGACKYLYRFNIKPNSINHILLTHFHGDHYFDMPFYILNKSKSDNKKVNVYCSKEGKRKIYKIGKLAFPNSFKEACIATNSSYYFNNSFMINSYKVNKLLVDHGRMKPAYGYIFNVNEKYVGFTGDTSLCKNVEIMSEKCCYLFCDCMLKEGNKKHMGIDNIKYLAEKYEKCTFVVSHLDDSTRDLLKELYIKNVIVPEDELLAQITGLLGGRVSEEMFLNEISTGASDDFKKATRIARSMVTEYGMSDLGPVQYEEKSENVFLGRDYAKSRDFSDQVALEIDEQVRKIIESCYTKAKKIIGDNKDLIFALSDALIKYETITKEQIESIVETGEIKSVEEIEQEEKNEEVKETKKKTRKTKEEEK